MLEATGVSASHARAVAAGRAVVCLLVITTGPAPVSRR